MTKDQKPNTKEIPIPKNQNRMDDGREITRKLDKGKRALGGSPTVRKQGHSQSDSEEKSRRHRDFYSESVRVTTNRCS